MVKLIERVDSAIARMEYGLLVVLMAALTLILSAQVVLRYFFNSPLFWAEEVAVQVLISATFIGVSYLTFTDKLVRIDFIIGSLRRPWQDILALALRLVGLGVLLVLCYHATEWIMRPEIKFDVSATTGLPRWYNYAILVLAFYAMTWHQLVRIIAGSSYVEQEGPGMRPAGMSAGGRVQ